MRDRKTQILEAAACLIADRGYTQTSIEDVIRESKLCGKGHFYHYFRSKEELGFAVLTHQFERFTEAGLVALRDPMSDPLERLNRFIDTVVALQAKQGCRGGGCSSFGGIASELADAHEGFRLKIAEVFERWAAQLQSLLWELRPRLREDVDTARLARFIIATLEGAVLMARVTREIGVMQEIAGELKRFIAEHVRASSAGPMGAWRVSYAVSSVTAGPVTQGDGDGTV